MGRKKTQSLTYNMPDNVRTALDTMIQKHGPEHVLMSMIATPTPQAVSDRFIGDKNSYAFWGPTTAELVRTPPSLYVPISMDAFKASAMEYEFKSPAMRAAYNEIFAAASQIYQWTRNDHLNEFFLKNSNFSGKHQWPFTCNVDFSHMPNATDQDRVMKIIHHIHNINSDAVLHWATPGMGLLARQKLDLAPIFYAFGSTFYKITNPETNQFQFLHFKSAQKDIADYMQQKLHENPAFTWEKVHIGMPITREVRIFSIDGKIHGHVPYWTPVAFKNKEVYGLGNGKTLDDALRELNTIGNDDIEHVLAQTKKIIEHPKFCDTDWAIDWVVTRDGTWYMIDMQTARSSYMDVENMKFVHPESQHVIYNFINNQMQNMIESRRNMSMFERMVLKFRGISTNIDDGMSRFGYPRRKQLQQIMRQISEKSK